MRRTIAVVLLAAGCRTSAPVVSPAPESARAAEPEVPQWVRRTPSPRGEVCAVGAVDKTYFVQDGVAAAGEAARAELAKTVEVRVSSVMVDYQSTRGGFVRASDVVEVISAVSEGVLHGAEIRSTWFDPRGVHLTPGMTYALACLRTDVPVEQLAESLKAKDPDAVQEVRKRAQRAFDELEAEEERSTFRQSTPGPDGGLAPEEPE